MKEDSQILIDERKFFLGKWLEKERNIFVVIAFAFGLPALLGEFSFSPSWQQVLPWNVVLAALYLGGLRLGTLRRQVGRLNARIGDEAPQHAYPEKPYPSMWSLENRREDFLSQMKAEELEMIGFGLVLAGWMVIQDPIWKGPT